MDYQWDYMVRSYKAKEIRDKSFERTLQEAGKLGWELFSIQNIGDRRDGELTLFFKRPIGVATAPASVDNDKFQYIPVRKITEGDIESTMDVRPPVHTESPVMHSQDPKLTIKRLVAQNESDDKTQEKKFLIKQFFPILENTLQENEEAIKTIQKNERHGIALTRKRVLLVKEEAWGNPKVISAEFIDIFEMDLRKFLGKYDFSMRYYDRRSENERIEVISLEETHLNTLVEIAEYVHNELASIGRKLELAGILTEHLSTT